MKDEVSKYFIGANMRRLSKHKITLIVIAVAIIVCTAIIFIFNGKVQNETEFLEEYFYERYDGLNQKNFYSRIKQLNKYYSDELLRSDSWVIDEHNLSETYKTISNFDSEAEIISIEINEAEESRYEVVLYVLYTTHATPENTHYIAYLMDVSLKDTMIGYKINNIDIVNSLPVFTGGQDVVVGEEIKDYLFGHNH